MSLRVAYFGTPQFAVPTLERLLASQHQVVAVVTQPDRPRGRGHRVSPSPVKALALDRHVPVLQPERLRDPEWLASLARLGADLAVVAAYGRILPQALLDLPRLGFINVHASLLPRWRGAAPIHRALLAGDVVTGVTIMRVVFALDAGPMLASTSTPIGDDDTSETVERRLSALGAELLIETVDRMGAGRVQETAQDEALVTYAARLERRESQIDWARPAGAVHRQIRGLQPWPLAAGLLRDRRLALLRATVEHSRALEVPPGTVVAVDPSGLVVATSPGALRVLEVLPEGRRAMPVHAFLNGVRIAPGDRFLPLPLLPVP